MVTVRSSNQLPPVQSALDKPQRSSCGKRQGVLDVLSTETRTRSYRVSPQTACWLPPQLTHRHSTAKDCIGGFQLSRAPLREWEGWVEGVHFRETGQHASDIVH